MLSVRLYGPDDLRIVEENIPEISPDELLIKVHMASVCGTDVRSWMYGKDFIDEDHPMTMGHEIVGHIEKAGSNVRGFSEGQRIAYVPCAGCGICDLCVSGNNHQCKQLVAVGINANGLMSEYVVADRNFISQGNIFAAPDDVSDISMTLNEPLSCVYNGFLKLDAEAGDTALVIGAGPIGVMHTQLLHMAGVNVLVSENRKERRELLKKIAPYAKVFEGNDLKEFVTENTCGKGLDIGITACPDPKAQQDILCLMGQNGRVHFFGGVPKEMEPVLIDTNLIHYNALKVVGTTCSNVAEFRKTLEFVRHGRINLDDMATGIFEKEDAIKAFETARECMGLKNIIKF